MLVVFDVDGTLIESVALDAELYDRAFLETFGVRLPTTDWATYRNATDAGIAEEAVERLGVPTAGVVELRRRFVELLETVEVIPAVAGARTIIGELRARGMAVAIATGGWSDAAAAKLRAAGVEVGDVPLVGSESSPRRADIIEAAIDRAQQPGADLLRRRRRMGSRRRTRARDRIRGRRPRRPPPPAGTVGA